MNDVISGETFDFNEMVDVLSLDTSDENKINLLKFTDEAISIIDTDYSNTVKIYILNNNLEENDIPKLLTAYLHENSPMKIEIENLTVRQKQVIFSESYPFLCSYLKNYSQIQGLLMKIKWNFSLLFFRL